MPVCASLRLHPTSCPPNNAYPPHPRSPNNAGARAERDQIDAKRIPQLNYKASLYNLYPKKTYVTRKDAIEDFVRNFNCKHPTSCIEIQYCDDCPDDNKLPASSKCCHCGKYLCHKHSIWVEPTTILSAPEKICHDCQLAGEQ